MRGGVGRKDSGGRERGKQQEIREEKEKKIRQLKGKARKSAKWAQGSGEGETLTCGVTNSVILKRALSLYTILTCTHAHCVYMCAALHRFDKQLDSTLRNRLTPRNGRERERGRE